MIDYIVCSDPTILDVSSYNNGPYTSGAVYWDANSRQFKIVDSNGSAFTMPAGTANINVGSKLKEMIVWFEQKKSEEQRIKALCDKYPNLAEAKKEFDVLYNLVKENDA
jgi:hypothetical protein